MGGRVLIFTLRWSKLRKTDFSEDHNKFLVPSLFQLTLLSLAPGRKFLKFHGDFVKPRSNEEPQNYHI